MREEIMERWATKRKKDTTFEGTICPKILDRLDKEKELTKYWIPRLGFMFLPHPSWFCIYMCTD